MDIIKSIGESAEGWRMGFSSLFGGVSAKFGGVSGAQIKPGDVEAGGKREMQEIMIHPLERDRYAAIKAAPIVRQAPGAPAPVGVRYIPSGEGRVGAVAPQATEDPGTPATVIERIQKSIGESAEGWRMGFSHVAGKAQAGIEKSLAGWGMGISHVGGKVSESLGNIGGGLSSFKYPLYILLFVFLFIAVMVAIGYSGVGGPTARIAEREHARRR